MKTYRHPSQFRVRGASVQPTQQPIDLAEQVQKKSDALTIQWISWGRLSLQCCKRQPNYRTMNGPGPRSSQLIYLISFGASRIVSTNYRPRSKTSGTALFRPKHGSNGSKERSSKNSSLQGRHQINDPRRDDRWRILAGPGATGCTQFHTASNCLLRQRT
jgi:hypothetical protein